VAVPDQSQDPNRRITKAERREEARLKRAELQRQMAKKRRNRLWGGVALVLVVASVVALVVLQPFAAASPQEILDQAPAAATAAGCDAVQTIGAYGGVENPDDPGYDDRTHVGPTFPAPKLSTYPSVPPTSGPHDPTPLHGGVYDTAPSIYQAIHSLEHGAAIVWYDPTASGPALEELKAFYSQKLASQNVSQDRVIVAPYDYPDQGEAGHLPSGVEMALVSWHVLRTCAHVSLPVAFDFTSQYAFPTYGGRTYAGQSPEAERGALI
jgi:hypothetical protein